MQGILFLISLSLICADGKILSAKLKRHCDPVSSKMQAKYGLRHDTPVVGGSREAAYYMDMQIGSQVVRKKKKKKEKEKSFFLFFCSQVRMDPDTGSSNFVVVTPTCGCSYYGTGYSPNVSQQTTCGLSCSNKTNPLFLKCDRCCGSVVAICFQESFDLMILI